MPQLTISLDDETYGKLVKYCGGKYYPEKVIVIMVKSFIRQDEALNDIAKKEGGN